MKSRIRLGAAALAGLFLVAPASAARVPVALPDLLQSARQPMRVVAPEPITVVAENASGVPASHPKIAAFLAGARGVDSGGDSVSITSDAPGVFPLGRVIVTFTARDNASPPNEAHAVSSVTVVLGPPVGPPALDDTTPPGNVARLTVAVGNRQVALRWGLPYDPDFHHVAVSRTPSAPGATTTVIYEGTGSMVVDRGLPNGVSYRYAVVSYDRAGNASTGVGVVARPQLRVLLAPAPGAVVTSPPLLRWATVQRASYYNVQLYRGKRKILSRWPTSARFSLPARWRQQGRVYRLTPDVYTWYVFPGFGARQNRQYGTALGPSFFVVQPR